MNNRDAIAIHKINLAFTSAEWRLLEQAVKIGHESNGVAGLLQRAGINHAYEIVERFTSVAPPPLGSAGLQPTRK